METTSLRFAEAARALADAARGRGWDVPAFRSPPRIPGDRSIRRRLDGGMTVAVRYRGRPWPAVLSDMIEGVVVTNEGAGERADRLRTDLWEAVVAAGLLGEGAPVPVAERRLATVKPLARVA